MFGHQDETNTAHDDNFVAAVPAVEPDSLSDESETSTAAVPAPDPAHQIHDNGVSPEIPVPATAPTATGPAPEDLLTIKQQALQELSPLIGHLDQTPEERFHTTMMMIQASDNQALIKEAYAAAQQISDEKTRAQALLDVINEVNYFTQHQTD